LQRTEIPDSRREIAKGHRSATALSGLMPRNGDKVISSVVAGCLATAHSPERHLNPNSSKIIRAFSDLLPSPTAHLPQVCDFPISLWETRGNGHQEGGGVRIAGAKSRRRHNWMDTEYSGKCGNCEWVIGNRSLRVSALFVN